MIENNDVFAEISMHLLQDERPSLYLTGVSETPLFEKYPFTLLAALKRTEQSPKHHPEGNVWNHTLLVVDEAAKVKSKSNNEKVFMWAALLHDIGKPDTTRIRKERITSYDHDKVGAELTRKFLAHCTEDQEFIDKVAALVRWHMQILFVVNDLPFADVKALKSQTQINEVALLGLCDRLGRLGAKRAQEESNVEMFIKKCNL